MIEAIISNYPDARIAGRTVDMAHERKTTAAMVMSPASQSPRMGQAGRMEGYSLPDLATTWQLTMSLEVKRQLCKPLVISSNLITGSPFVASYL